MKDMKRNGKKKKRLRHKVVCITYIYKVLL